MTYLLYVLFFQNFSKNYRNNSKYMTWQFYSFIVPKSRPITFRQANVTRPYAKVSTSLLLFICNYPVFRLEISSFE